MENKVYGYARVSSKEQNLDRQLIALKEYGVEEKNIKCDKASGKDFNREGYQILKNELLRSGDTLVIKELDRLGRDMNMIKEEWQELIKIGINIVVIDTEILNTQGKSDLEKNLISNIVFELLSYMAEKERQKIKIRQREGIEALKDRNYGKGIGRPSAEYPVNFKEVYNSWKAKEINATKAMETLDLKRTTFYKLVKQYEDN
ncbi:DNA recombinase [Clostridium gelidum]|uniref:DNA recombinase n=1 Tax=Clostridium gelidum TaxID=704125 RepID=A0ABN6J479_9CLOT|nr:DNA recombinase [Clostridium gelidum]